MGMFAEVLNIRPWELGRLARVEFEGLCEYLDRRDEQAKKATG